MKKIHKTKKYRKKLQRHGIIISNVGQKKSDLKYIVDKIYSLSLFKIIILFVLILNYAQFKLKQATHALKCVGLLILWACKTSANHQLGHYTIVHMHTGCIYHKHDQL